MTVEDRIRKLRIKQAIILAISAFVAYLIFGNPTTSAWFSNNITPHLGKVLAAALQLAMGFFYMIFQFVGLMYFLAGARCEVVLPGDAQVVTLEDDFWGLPELKKRARSMVLILQGHTNLVEMGGEPATGVLLSGPPGTGKTYLARCMAGSAGVPFMLMEAGTLTSMWMGVGAIMVRRKGAQAKKLAKRYGACVWVLDEIDSIASSRGGMGMGVGMGGGGFFGGMGAMAKNALFAVMDGLANPPGIMGWLMRKLYGLAGMKLPPADYTVLVMGTTNRPRVLDPALLRSGRMDIKWQINPPRTDKGLAEIIAYYLGMVKHEDDFGPEDLVNIFRGSTPADIKVTIKRIATSTAVREGCDMVSRQHVEMALIEALLGLEDPLDDPLEEDLTHTAYHEAGHLIAVLALYNRENELVPAFATIVPHTGTGQLGRVLGVVVPRLVRPRDSVPMHFFERSIMVSMAGREGEFLGTGQYGMGFGGDRVNIQRSLLALVMNCAIGYPASLLLTPGAQGYSLTGLPKSAQEKLEPWINAFVTRTQALLQANKVPHRVMTDLLLEHGTITAVQLEQFVEDHALVVPPDVKALWAKKEDADAG
jgi:cell division protease FtsH